MTDDAIASEIRAHARTHDPAREARQSQFPRVRAALLRVLEPDRPYSTPELVVLTGCGYRAVSYELLCLDREGVTAKTRPRGPGTRRILVGALPSR